MYFINYLCLVIRITENECTWSNQSKDPRGTARLNQAVVHMVTGGGFIVLFQDWKCCQSRYLTALIVYWSQCLSRVRLRNWLTDGQTDSQIRGHLTNSKRDTRVDGSRWFFDNSWRYPSQWWPKTTSRLTTPWHTRVARLIQLIPPENLKGGKWNLKKKFRNALRFTTL